MAVYVLLRACVSLLVVTCSTQFGPLARAPPHALLPPPCLHSKREALESQAACARFAHHWGLDEVLAVGRGYEGNNPSDRMMAGEQRCRGSACRGCGATVPAALPPARAPPRCLRRQLQPTALCQHAFKVAQKARLPQPPGLAPSLPAQSCRRAEAFEAVLCAIYLDSGRSLESVRVLYLAMVDAW